VNAVSTGRTRSATLGAVRPLNVLVVCTANVCRSPMFASLLGHHLGGAGVSAEVVSGGTTPTDLPVDPCAVRAMAELGFDISGHQPRTISRDLINVHGADLVLTMTRQHLRVVTTTAVGSLPRTFTARELRRRLLALRATDDGGQPNVLAAMSAGRRASHLIADNPADDVADPYGSGLATTRGAAAQLNELASEIVDLLGGAGWPRLVEAESGTV
jgi:protein-tyrosine-phosphatase